VICASTIIVLSATSIVLGWLVHHQGKAMSAQKTALEATKATVDALKTQSDLKIEPLKETINAKEAQLSAANERKVLAEEQLKAHQEQLNRLIAELPSGLRQIIQTEVDNEREFILRTAGSLFLNFGYYLGVMNLSTLVLQIQSLTFARIDKESPSPLDYAIKASVGYLKDSVLFLHRERRIALERSAELLRMPPRMKVPESMVEQLAEHSTADQMLRDSGLVIDSEVDGLSSMKNLPFDLASFKD
jgi:hypothetical protein